MSGQDRIREERVVADANALLALNNEQLARWNRCQSTHRFLSFVGKRIIAYRLMLDEPQIQTSFTCEGVTVTETDGLISLWRSREGVQFAVGHAPVEVAANCFMWMPKYNGTILQDSETRGRPSFRFAVLYRVLANPAKRVDGITYLVEQSSFNHIA